MEKPWLNVAAFPANRLRLVESAPPVNDSFGVGDFAELRSGGPRLLVVGSDEGDGVAVAWRNASGTHEGVFVPCCLRRLV